MFETLQRISKRIFRLENLPTVIALIVSFGVVILDILGWIGQDIILTTLLLSIGVLALGVLVERITYLDRIETSIAQLRQERFSGGISHVFERRDQLPEYQSYIASAKKEILITGLALATTTARFLDLLKNKAISGCSIKILLISPPKDEEGLMTLRSLSQMLGISEEILRKQIESSQEFLATAINSLDTKSRARFEVRTYRLNPTYGVLSIDGGTPTGKILLALYPYRVSEVNWPVLELKHQDGKESLYDFFYKRTKQMWSDAISIELFSNEAHS